MALQIVSQAEQLLADLTAVLFVARMHQLMTIQVAFARELEPAGRAKINVGTAVARPAPGGAAICPRRRW